MILPVLVSVGVPLVFLHLVRRLDLYASGGFDVVLMCFVWGLVAFPISVAVNTAALRGLGLAGIAAAAVLVRIVVAPVVEEIVKSVSLVYFERQPEFTYFVDGAIYGFAAGTAFAILENLYFLQAAEDTAALGLSVNRVLSTSLMHGSASALVGISIGRFRFGRGSARPASLLLGWGAAIALHMSFNLVVSQPHGAPVVAEAMLIGLGGVALTAVMIAWGLREERQWLRESLSPDLGVTASEAAVVQRLDEIETLLAPIEARFGARKRAQVEALLRIQARLGLKTKTHDLTSDPTLRAELGTQIIAMRQEMDALRQAVGVYCMTYVRSILPPGGEPIWDQLDVALADEREPGPDLWQLLASKSGSSTTSGPADPPA